MVESGQEAKALPLLLDLEVCQRSLSYGTFRRDLERGRGREAVAGISGCHSLLQSTIERPRTPRGARLLTRL